jgi:hypothetical protein
MAFRRELTWLVALAGASRFISFCREGEGGRRAENGGYANRETALMFPIVGASSGTECS